MITFFSEKICCFDPLKVDIHALDSGFSLNPEIFPILMILSHFFNQGLSSLICRWSSAWADIFRRKWNKLQVVIDWKKRVFNHHIHRASIKQNSFKRKNKDTSFAFLASASLSLGGGSKISGSVRFSTWKDLSHLELNGIDEKSVVFLKNIATWWLQGGPGGHPQDNHKTRDYPKAGSYTFYYSPRQTLSI